MFSESTSRIHSAGARSRERIPDPLLDSSEVEQSIDETVNDALVSRQPSAEVPPGAVRILPIGGVGEIGKNCMFIETAEDAIIVDAGLKFPSEEMLGVDLVIPDISYVLKKRHLLRAIFITHGHEDHIGALPYLLPDLDVPVYATALTKGLISVRLKEHRLLDEATLRVMQPGDVIDVGSIRVEPFAVTHSIPDCVGLAIQTPAGILVHSGDFKFDSTPVYGPPIDREALARLGKHGVLALLSDCVRVEKPGYTPSEQTIGEAFDTIIGKCKGRVIIATFASNISRIQQAVDVAKKHGRRVAVVGRSMVNNCAIASELGFLRAEGTLVKIEELRKRPHEEALLMTTGSQGEPSSGLSRIANNDHRQIKLIPGDTVIVSATPIPGNEETVAHTIDNLLRLGAEVIYEPLANVHVSGHASREDLKLLIELLQPRYCVPIHGQYRHMVLYRQAAGEVGVPAENVHLIDVGDVLEFGPDGVRHAGHVPIGSVLVDGITVGATTEVVLRDRQHLSRDGIVIAAITLDRMTGELLADPEIMMRGLPNPPSDEDVVEGARQKIREVLKRAPAGEVEYGFLVQRIREGLAESIHRQLRARPMILPVITEV